MNAYNGTTITVTVGSNKFIYPTVCFSYEEEKQPHGVFHSANILDFVFPVFMVQILMAFFLSWSVYFVLRPLRQPKFVCNVLAGIILGPSVLGRNHGFMNSIFAPKEMLILNTLARISIVYFVFIVAVKMDTYTMLKASKKIWPIALLGYVLPFAASLAFSLAMQKQFSSCLTDMSALIFICGALAVAYFPVLAQTIEELDLLTTEFGQLTLSSSMLIQTTSYVFTLAGLVVTRESPILSFLYFLVVCVTILFAVYIIRPVLLLIVKKTPEGKPVREIYVIAVLVGVLLMSALTDLTWLDSLSGAFLMGLIVPDGPPFGATIVEKSELMIMQFFLPLFFVQVGYATDVSTLKNVNSIIMVLLLVVICYSTKIIGTLLASIWLKIRLEIALSLGVILNFKGVLDFTTFHLLHIKNILHPQCYTALVLFNVLFVAIFYPLIEILCKPQVGNARQCPKIRWSKSLQSALPDEELRALTCIYHEDNVHGIIALLEAMNNKVTSHLCAYVVHAVDLVGKSAPSLVPYKIQEKNGKDVRGSSVSHIMLAFRNYSRNRNGHVSIQPFTMEAPFRTMHNIICSLAEERHIPFTIVPFQENKTVDSNSKQKGALQDFNSQLQANAPCTVGILFDSGFQLPGLNNLTCRIVVLFVGSTDDREALALAIRMSGNPHVNITMIRINSTKDHDTNLSLNISERQLDDLLVKEFKEISKINPGVVCHEVKVNESIEMINVIQSLPKTHDLIVVGKNSGARHFEKELMEWTEYPELGVIGDMLCSSNLSAAKMSSVLVMQHSVAVNRSIFPNFIIKSSIRNNETASKVLPAVS